MNSTETNNFFTHLADSISQHNFIKLTLSDRRNKNAELKSVSVKPVQIKAVSQLQFVYRYPTKDITKNYSANDSVPVLQQMLEQDFFKADLFTTGNNFHLTINTSGKTILTIKPSSNSEPVNTRHDKIKKRYVNAEDNIYLYELGITSSVGKVKADKQDKFRQINKYVEIVEDIIEEAQLPTGFTIADMGAGKGYLTFALYDYLTNQLQLQPGVTGIELRQQLVDTCNTISAKAGFTKLHFTTGSIDTTELPPVNMLIALHACDIATDQAIFRGIRAGTEVIICAPCCHKQIRKQMHPDNALSSITRFGILEEREAEIVTDTIRALMLEAFGYKTKVFEFISTEHTPKNILITGVKSKQYTGINQKALEKIKELKALFNIEQHELERLMEI